MANSLANHDKERPRFAWVCSGLGHDHCTATALQDLGETYRLLSRFKEAEKAFKEAHEIHSRIGLNSGVANALLGLEQTYCAQSKIAERGREGFQGSVRYPLSHWPRPRYGKRVARLGTDLPRSIEHREAEKAFKQAYEIHSRNRDDTESASALQFPGDVYGDQSKYKEAERAFREAREIHSRIGNENGTADVLVRLGEIYASWSRDSDAEKAFMEAYEIHSRIGNDHGAASAGAVCRRVLYNPMISRRWLFIRSPPAFRTSQLLTDSGVSSAASGMFGLGNIYHTQSKYQQAEEAFIKAHEIHSRIDHTLGTANALHGLGEMYRARVRFQEAERAVKEAHEIHSRIGNQLGMATASGSLGRIYRLQSRFHDADREHLGTANALRCLGMLRHDQGRYDEAETSYRQALAAYERTDNVDGRARALAALGQVQHAQYQYPEAEEALTETLAIWTSLDNDHRQAAAALILSQIFRSQSKSTEEADALIQVELALVRSGQDASRALILDAEECFSQARTVFAGLADDDGEAKALDRLMAVLAAQRKFEDAKVAYMDACEIYARTGLPTGKSCVTMCHLFQFLEERPELRGFVRVIPISSL
ncbi:hypothetical protein FRC00_008385 [Tulasnella sp. 408]|nr:hypothetical protein FRC00_008385 [Tulasnella sp. 408]